jgi:hypothetical protein
LSLLGERPNARTIFLALLMLCSMLAISADSQVGVACGFVLQLHSLNFLPCKVWLSALDFGYSFGLVLNGYD